MCGRSGLMDELYLDASDTQDPVSPIARLEQGDCITLKAGYGHPWASEDRELVIASVEGNSALTCDGTCLNCEDIEGIVPQPGKKAPIVLSERAKEIMASVGL